MTIEMFAKEWYANRKGLRSLDKVFDMHDAGRSWRAGIEGQKPKTKDQSSI
jgi:hypothetical protein